MLSSSSHTPPPWLAPHRRDAFRSAFSMLRHRRMMCFYVQVSAGLQAVTHLGAALIALTHTACTHTHIGS